MHSGLQHDFVPSAQRKGSPALSMGCVSPPLRTQNSLLIRSHEAAWFFSHISIYPHQDEALGTETMKMREKAG